MNMNESESTASRSVSASASPPAPSAAAILYTHALECIFAFSELRGLAQLSQVCHRWQTAVLSMAPCSLRIDISKLTYTDAVRITSSRMSRHVAHLEDGSVEPHTMHLFALHMPHLRSLRVTLEGESPVDFAALLFPPQLRDLFLDISVNESAAALHSTLDVMSRQLVHLQSLIIYCFHCEFVSFVPLIRFTQLRRLDMRHVGPPSDVQMHQLRMLSQVDAFLPPSDTPLRDLLAPGHVLKLSGIGPLYSIVQQDCDALITLPSLTSLKLVSTLCTNIDFVRSLPLMSKLMFSPNRYSQPEWPRIATALNYCVHLTELGLFECGLTTDQLEECLTHMPLLRVLILTNLYRLLRIHSLSFLRAGTLSTTLQTLSLKSCSSHTSRLPFKELRHVGSLHGLKKLYIQSILATPSLPEQDDEVEEYYNSIRLPLLKECCIEEGDQQS
jgi:hypothetical protein